MSGLGRTFVSLFAKNFTQLGWHEYDSETERQLVRPLWRISPIGTSDTLWNCTTRKRTIFMGILQKISLGHMNFILRGIQCKCFQVMSLLTGPGMSPPRCGKEVTGTVTNCCVTVGKLIVSVSSSLKLLVSVSSWLKLSQCKILVSVSS